MRKKSHVVKVISYLIAVVLWSAQALNAAPASEKIALKKEIAEWEQKIKEIKKEINQTKEKADIDKKDFDAYASRHDSNVKRLDSDLDSLKKEYKTIEKNLNALSYKIHEQKNFQNEYESRQVKFSSAIIEFCDLTLEKISKFPPSEINLKQKTSINFLKSEIITKTVENIEALERLWQIINTLDDESSTIEAYTAKSPIPAIEGQADFLRLGHSYLACVNEKASVGAIWVLDQNKTTGTWEPITDQSDLLSLQKAVRVKLGKGVPELVKIPFKHEVLSGIETKQNRGN